jgi:hypothetical protein
MSGSQPTERELLTESSELLERKKQAGKHMNVIAAETSKTYKIPKNVLNRLKDYNLYYKKGWVSNNPLDIDKSAKEIDKLSPMFMKLLQVVEDLRMVNSQTMLDPYIKELNGHGIKIYIDPGKQIVSDEDEVLNAVGSMGIFQKEINTISEEIKEDKASEADDINLTAKSEFPRLLSFYHKKEQGKDIDDEYQSKIEYYNLVETSYNKVYDDSLT